MSKKIFFISTLIIFSIVSSNYFIGSSPDTQVLNGSYNLNDYNTNGDFSLRFTDPNSPTTFAFKLNGTNLPEISLTKAKLQNIINKLDYSQITSDNPNISSSHYQRTQQLQVLNKVMEIMNNPQAFKDLHDRLEAQGMFHNDLSTKTINYGNNTVTVESSKQ